MWLKDFSQLAGEKIWKDFFSVQVESHGSSGNSDNIDLL